MYAMIIVPHLQLIQGMWSAVIVLVIIMYAMIIVPHLQLIQVMWSAVIVLVIIMYAMAVIVFVIIMYVHCPSPAAHSGFRECGVLLLFLSL
eukprot:TRINITY_DN44944_c0_g1_i1.p2 TRINITY_DN44944_c0_g1~~TRINITY_DN44944_c0_g1_i1.p2  ORF type:complete len:104 (+),score=6.58 TRINITY_DN44944_c0_g1_i1:42-314(+)